MPRFRVSLLPMPETGNRVVVVDAANADEAADAAVDEADSSVCANCAEVLGGGGVDWEVESVEETEEE